MGLFAALGLFGFSSPRLGWVGTDVGHQDSGGEGAGRYHATSTFLHSEVSSLLAFHTGCAGRMRRKGTMVEARSPGAGGVGPQWLSMITKPDPTNGIDQVCDRPKS